MEPALGMERSCRGDANSHSHFKALFLLLEQEREVLRLPQSASSAPTPWSVMGCSQLIPNHRGAPTRKASAIAHSSFS